MGYDYDRSKTAAMGGLLARYSQFMTEVADAAFKRLGMGWKVEEPTKSNILSSTIWIGVSASAPPPEFQDANYKWGASVTVEKPGMLEIYVGTDKGQSVATRMVSVDEPPKFIGTWIAGIVLGEAKFLSGKP